MIHPYARPPRPPLEPIEDVEQTHLEGLTQFICFVAALAFAILLVPAFVRHLHGG